LAFTPYIRGDTWGGEGVCPQYKPTREGCIGIVNDIQGGDVMSVAI